MLRFVGESSDSGFDIGGSKRPESAAVLPRDEFGERGAGGDRRGAAADLKACRCDAAAFDERREAKDVAADGVRDFDGDGWSGQFAHIAGIAEVLDELGAHIRKDNEVTTVVAGVLEREGRVFICQRREDQAHALKWEFPGGKVEAGESPEAALVRELSEELGIEAAVDHEIMRYEFSYPEKKPILLIFFAVTKWQGEMGNRIFRAVAWEQPEKLREFDFLEGDAPFIAAQAE